MVKRRRAADVEAASMAIAIVPMRGLLAKFDPNRKQAFVPASLDGPFLVGLTRQIVTFCGVHHINHYSKVL
ncbi:MAG: hypothetical protein AAF543_15020 [Pseudomonadota bacterium]